MNQVKVLSDRQIELIARALAEPRRVQMLKLIGSCDGSIPCSAIQESQDVTPATLSHHAKELENAGLIRGIKDGKFMRYELDRDVLQAYLNSLSEI